MAGDVGSSHVRTDFGELSDADLVRATREGSRRAYAALYARHSLSALKYAKTLTSSDADDVVSEAFLKVYAAIKAGRGPEEDFRYYIRSAVRNTYVSMVRARRTAPAGDAIEDVVGDRGADIASLRSFDGSVTARAFLSLPARWQEVLWYTEVEGFTREHTATLLGMNANAVSALSFRAREGLRTAWLQEHITAPSDLDRGCEAITPLLGAYSRQGLSRRDRLRVEHHVNGCAHCTSIVGELAELLTPGRLALILLPVVLPGGGYAAFAAKFGGGSAAAVSASAVAPPTAVLASVGGGSAASGAAALSVVGKVAACAIVATMIVPPTQMLIVAAQHHAPVSHHHSTTSAEPQLDLGALLLVDTSPAHVAVVADSESDTSESSSSEAGMSDAATVVNEEASEGAGKPDASGNGNPNANGNANSNANGNGALNGNANGNANVNGASGSANANANANGAPDAPAKGGESAKLAEDGKANASSAPEAKGVAGAVNANAQTATATTATATTANASTATADANATDATAAAESDGP
jgi:RNA polymerase sigma factor (sigma-70 family)